MKEYLHRIFPGSKEDFIKHINLSLISGKREFVVTANPEILMKAENDSYIREFLLDGSGKVTIVPDGISVVKVMQRQGIPVTERITGVDITEKLLETAGKNNLSVYLLGASQEVVSRLAKQEKLKYPKAVYHFHNGYDGDKDSIFEEIKILQPDLIIVALGVPAQEKLIYKHFNDFSKGVFIGVGGSFDVLSGSKRRAPRFFVQTNTEWLYRILREPSRIKRFYESNVKFMRHSRRDSFEKN